MAAHDNLHPQQFFHVAPDSARESIAAGGLDHRSGERMWPGVKYPQGTYLFGDEGAAHEYREGRERHEQDEYGMEARSFDVYHVTVPSTAKLHKDPFHDDESGLGKSSVYTKAALPPTALKRL